MVFITDDDFDVQVKQEILAIISSPSSIDIAEKMAIDQIKAYISGTYDTDTIFAQTDEERNYFIVMITIDLMLYHLWAKKAANKTPILRKERYKEAIDWLIDVGNGTIDTDLPQKPIEEYEGNIKIYSTHSPNNNKF